MHDSRSAAGVYRFAIAALLILALSLASPGAAVGDDVKYNEKAMAAYADAANFQTNGAIELAIEAWKKYLTNYPQEPLVAKAWHYLGVCYMQKSDPDYVAAADAFERAIKDPKSELREESLVNLGWCQFAASGEGEQQDPERLRKALQAFKTVIKEKPNGKFVDRALFYGGEAAYALGDAKEAVALYDRLLSLDAGKESPLRCDTLYARGIALEDLQRHNDAMASYRQLLEGCKDNRLVIDARIRIGDASIAQKQYDEAIKQFGEVTQINGPERPYALLRQAFALVQADRASEAAVVYERLVQEFPDSPHAAAAALASAQSSYRSGDLDEAAKRFQRVLSQKDPAAATEAAHWLALIGLRKGNPEAAARIARKQIDAGAAGPYANMLRMDLAEATMLIPGKTAEALELYRALYTAAPQSPEAPRALYNAAFAAMQLGQHKQATQWARDFAAAFPNDPLLADVRYIAAESKLMSGAVGEAAEAYLRLVNDPASQSKIQRPLWVMRTATALSLAGKNEAAVELLEKNQAGFRETQQKAEGLYLTGSLHLAAGRGEQAAEALSQALAADASWPRADEVTVQLGQAHLVAGAPEKAAQTWKQAIKQFPNSPRSDQARYRLAQLAARDGEHLDAAEQFAQLLQSALDPTLIPFALYGRGWNLMRADQPAEALQPLDQLLAQHSDHPIAGDAKLARGMCLRALGKRAEAVKVLEQYLATDPQGPNRGHALYELALIDQEQQRPERAAARLEQLVSAVPAYPEMEKVLYEWAWSLKESGQDDQAEARFGQLIEQYPDDPLTAEGHYFIGQRRYAAEAWGEAAKSYAAAAKAAKETAPQLREKALYRWGWSLHQGGDFRRAIETFSLQAKEFPQGRFLPDALLMVGEGHFKLDQFEPALAAYEVARGRIIEQDESENQFEDIADRQVRELVFLHGGQSLAQLKRWEPALSWYQELEKRFPSSDYLPQARYETGFALQQSGKEDEALRVFEQLADEQRNEIGARARFMMGEIHFGRRDFASAIPEFQRVMYGYGADAAPEPVRNWQAKSGYEAGRCAEFLMENASGPDRRQKSAQIAVQFFQYVVDKHPKHELAPKSQERLEVLRRMRLDTKNQSRQNPPQAGS